MDFFSLDPLLRRALEEDIGRGDLTTEAILSAGPKRERVGAQVVARQAFVLAGWPLFVRVFELLGPTRSDTQYQDGQTVTPGLIGSLEASPDVILRGERVALNFLQRLSGIATQTRLLCDQIAHTGVQILDTRKTTPLLRNLEKYAVRMGGGKNHRLGLDDGILIKENHIALAGGVEEAIQACIRRARHLQKIEVEVRDLKELAGAIQAGADVILLDNMGLDDVRAAVEMNAGRCRLEVSGGVSRANLTAYAETGVDYISLGALTHSFGSADISLLVEPMQ